MTAILDYCVPSRRRERHERKEQQALASRVNSRWGDTQITAPSEGGWNQLGYSGEQGRDLPSVQGSPQTSGSSVSTTPDLNLLYDKAIEAGISIDHPTNIVQLAQPREEKKNISFTITLPWPSRRVNSPPTAPAHSTTSSVSRAGQPGTNSRPSTSHSTTPTAYMPASDRYIQPIMNPLAQSPPDAAVETFPVRMYTTSPGSFVQDMADVGLGSDSAQDRGASPVDRAAVDPVARHRPTPPLQQHTSPIMRLEPIPATPYCVDNFTDDPRMERPEAVIPSHPAVVTERAPRARSSSREPHSERYARERMRSSSRGPSEDRMGVVRPSSRGPVADRSSTIRSSSRGPAEDRVGGRTASQGPAADRVPAPRSSSRDSAWDRAGSGGRSSSRGPATDRVGSERSSSRGPPLERSGRPRSSSMGPPAGRITTVRSASREPTAERLAYSRSPDHRGSFSSDSSSSTMFSDDLEEARARARRKPRIPGGTDMPNVSPNGVGQFVVAPPSGGCSGTREGATTVGGYYSSLASEYRMIAKDGERENHSQLQFHNESSDSSEGKDFKDKDYKKALKERLKETYNEAHTLVPNSTDLYG